jgi:uncharacterized protein YbjT (DUF2867 family)
MIEMTTISASPPSKSSTMLGTLGAARASHVDARDIGRVIATTLTEPIDRHAGRVHLITGPAAVTFAEIADTLSDRPRKSVVICGSGGPF